MRILIAEDDPISCRLLQATLARWGHDVVVATDGEAAWRALQAAEAPPLAILDWMMPGLDGVEVCRRLRALTRPTATYVILLTAKGSRTDIVAGFEAGADDYLTKPFDRAELRARLNAGMRIVTLQLSLADRVRALEEALGQVRTLSGLLPICAYCKKVRNDKNYWEQVETYVADRSHAQFSHSICPGCYETRVKPELEALRRERGLVP